MPDKIPEKTDAKPIADDAKPVADAKPVDPKVQEEAAQERAVSGGYD